MQRRRDWLDLYELPDGLPIEDDRLQSQLSVRTANCLRDLGFTTVGELRNATDADLKRAPNIGLKSIREIRAAVEKIHVPQDRQPDM